MRNLAEEVERNFASNHVYLYKVTVRNRDAAICRSISTALAVVLAHVRSGYTRSDLAIWVRGYDDGWGKVM